MRKNETSESTGLMEAKGYFKKFFFPVNGVFEGSNRWCVFSFLVTATTEGCSFPKYKPIKVSGEVCFEFDPDTEYNIAVEETEHPKYGKQYKLISISAPIDFSNEANQKIFLSRIITSRQIENLYHCLPNPFRAIEEGDIESLCMVNGIGEATANLIIAKYKERIKFGLIYTELAKYELTDKVISKLLSKFNGDPQVVVSEVKKNPYILAELDNVGFKKADTIARRVGVKVNDSFRLRALGKFILKNKAEEGISWMTLTQFFNAVAETADSNDDYLDEKKMLDILDNDGDFIIWFSNEIPDDELIALCDTVNLKKELASYILGLNQAECSIDIDWELGQKLLKEQEKVNGWRFTDEQTEAVKGIIEHNIVVVTGGAGVGKTTTIGAFVNMLDRSQYSVAQTALSGRASARMAEISGEEGYTIHRLLGWEDGQFKHDESFPLDSDIVIVDEASMIGADIFLSLIKAVRQGSKVVILGDVGQLESIGKGNVFKDLIQSGVIPCYHLTKPHRQALKSGIIELSTKIRNQQQCFPKGYSGRKVLGELQDCELEIYKERQHLVGAICSRFEELIEENEILEVQVIVPNNKRGQLSCDSLNPILQDIYNPYKEGMQEIEIGGGKGSYTVRVGDKVINRKNRYRTTQYIENENEVSTDLLNDLDFDLVDLELMEEDEPRGAEVPIFNGDIGIVEKIVIKDEGMSFMVINFGNKGLVKVEEQYMDSIKLGYVITTHSSQGSQFNQVIYACDYGAYTLLTKEQVYTGVSRAKKGCIVIAEGNAFRKAVNTSEVSKKQTFLGRFLRKRSARTE